MRCWGLGDVRGCGLGDVRGCGLGDVRGCGLGDVRGLGAGGGLLLGRGRSDGGGEGLVGGLGGPARWMTSPAYGPVRLRKGCAEWNQEKVWARSSYSMHGAWKGGYAAYCRSYTCGGAHEGVGLGEGWGRGAHERQGGRRSQQKIPGGQLGVVIRSDEK